MSIQYILKISKRSRRIRVAVSDGRVIVAAPPRISKEYLDRIVAGHEAWIERAIRKHEKLTAGVKLACDCFNQREFISTVKKIIRDRYAKIAAPYGARLHKISVKKMRSRWGSCSGKGNVSINLLLGHLSEELLEYVVVHEISHMVHHNHSKFFWSLIEKYVPEYKMRKRELRRYGRLLSSLRSR